MRSAVLALALLTLLPAFGGQQPNSAPPNSAHNCTISGAVSDAENGQPLGGAQIELSLEDTINANLGGITDDSGRFEIKNIPPGRYEIWASHTGYISTQYGQRNTDGQGKPLTLAAGQSITDLSFRLPREAVITGHVYDEKGNAIQGAQAGAFIYGYSGGKRQLLFVKSAATDDRGEYRLFDLAAGTYFVLAEVGPGFSYGKRAMSYSATYYPGVADASAASPITVRAGDEFNGVDFSLIKVATFHIRGRVVGAAGAGPGNPVSVQLNPTKANFAYMPKGANVDSPNGAFDISDVRPGSYELTAWITPGGGGLQASQRVQVADSDVNGVTLVVAPGATLRGHVEVEGAVDTSNVYVDLEPQGLASYGIYEAKKLQGGTFEIENLMDGNYRVELSSALPPNAYLKSATLDGQDVLESGISVAGGQAPGSTLIVVISGNGGRIGGSAMLGGKPLRGAVVTLAPADESKLSDPLWLKDTASDQNGDFLIQGIRPGDYRVLAWQKIEEGEDLDPNLLKRFEHRGYEVQVSESSFQTLRLDAIPASETLSAAEK